MKGSAKAGLLCAALLIGILICGNWYYAVHNLPTGEVPFDSGAEVAVSAKAEKVLTLLSDEEKVGQLLMPAYESAVSLETMHTWLCEYHIGGYMILRKDVTPEMSQQLLDLHKACSRGAESPLFVAFDAEPSLMQYRLPNAGEFGETKDIHTAEESEQMAQKIAAALKPLGVNVNFAPMYDSADNQIITKKRSFGGSAEHIILLANAFASSTSAAGILPTAKHFPGHGTAQGDTHEELQIIPGSLPELPQFISAIQFGIPFMMVGHLAVSGGTWDTSGLPATLSKKIMIDLLRGELGYKGITITDAFNMKAVSGVSGAEVKAIEAGADIVLMPHNMDKTYTGLLTKMKDEEDFRLRINESVLRILTAKFEYLDTM